MNEPTGKEILDVVMDPGNEAGVETIRQYLVSLLTVLWDEKEGFSGKRPHGNSGWDADFDVALIKAGFVEGEINEWGSLEDSDDEMVDRLMKKAIQSLNEV